MSDREASKYESTIQLQWTRARKSTECYSCGNAINPGDYYYRQSLALIRKPPGVRLNAFCLHCRCSPLAEKLDTGLSYKGNDSAANSASPGKLPLTSDDLRDEDIQTQPSLFLLEELSGE